MTLSTTESGAGGLDLSTATPPASPYEKAQVEYKAQLDALIKQQNNLVASLDSRQSAGNPFFALAQGFLAPTKGGGFGESAGNAMQLFGAQQEQERKLNQETAMMRMQLAQASLAPYKEQMEMARKASMSGDIRKLLSGEGGQPIKPSEAPDVARSMGIDPLGPAAASLIGKSQPAASNRNNLFNQFDPTTKSLLMTQAAVDPEGTVKDLVTFGMKDAGRTDKMKEMTWFADQFPAADRQRLMQFAANRALLGDPAAMVTALQSVSQLIDKEVDVATNTVLRAFLIDQLRAYGYGSTAQPSTSTATAGTVTSSGKDPVNMTADSSKEAIKLGRNLDASGIQFNIRVPAENITSTPVDNLTESQRKLRDQNLQDIQTARNKAAEAERIKAYAGFNGASRDRQASADVTALVNESPKMFGVFEKPTYAAAIGSLAEEAVRLGNFTAGIPGIRKAVSNIGALPKDIDNLQKVGVIAINMSLAVAEAQKGSVSNFERILFSQANLSTHDTPNVLLYKADLLRARAGFYSILWDDFRKFEKANPSANFTDYQDKAGRPLIDRYEAQLARLRDNYIR